MAIDLRTHCYVPQTARLLQAFGGPDIGPDVVISLRTEQVRRFPGDRFERAIDAPDGRLDGGGMLPLWICRTRSERLVPESDWISLHIGFRGTNNGDGYWNTLYGFRVPRLGWEQGLWAVDLFLFDLPISYALHADSLAAQIELNRKASQEWESPENLALTDALMLAESQPGAAWTPYEGGGSAGRPLGRPQSLGDDGADRRCHPPIP